MLHTDIAQHRLHNQHLSVPTFEKPEEIVARFGAIQAQDYGAAKWAIGLRTRGVSNAAIDHAFADGRILRTHVLRPTWHFVTPADIRWMLQLTAPHVHAYNAYYYRKTELDAEVCAQTNSIVAKALTDGQHRTRPELVAALKEAGIRADDELRIALIMMYAELEGIVCSGALRGKQQTYALLEARAPKARTLLRDEALVALAMRYIVGHAPVTLKDFVWWSGLSTAEAEAAFAMLPPQFEHDVIGDQTYWFTTSAPSQANPSPTAYLLPNFDEYTVGYTDRSAIFDKTLTAHLDERTGSPLNYVIVIDGRIVGLWRRTLQTRAVVIELLPFSPLTAAERTAIAVSAERYGQFMGLPVTLR